jgi:hypothetical protein
MGLNTGMTTTTTTTVTSLAQDVVRGWEMAWEGRRIWREAEDEANRIGATYEDEKHKALWCRRDAGEQMQAAGDKIVIDAEMRADAAGIDILDVIYLAEQLRDAKNN